MAKVFRVTALNYDGTVQYSVYVNKEQLPQEIIDGQNDGYAMWVEYLDQPNGGQDGQNNNLL